MLQYLLSELNETKRIILRWPTKTREELNRAKNSDPLAGGRKHERHSPLPARTQELSDEQKVSRMLHTTGNILQSR